MLYNTLVKYIDSPAKKRALCILSVIFLPVSIAILLCYLLYEVFRDIYRSHRHH